MLSLAPALQKENAFLAFLNALNSSLSHEFQSGLRGLTGVVTLKISALSFITVFQLYSKCGRRRKISFGVCLISLYL